MIADVDEAYDHRSGRAAPLIVREAPSCPGVPRLRILKLCMLAPEVRHIFCRAC